MGPGMKPVTTPTDQQTLMDRKSYDILNLIKPMMISINHHIAPPLEFPPPMILKLLQCGKELLFLQLKI